MAGINVFKYTNNVNTIPTSFNNNNFKVSLSQTNTKISAVYRNKQSLVAKTTAGEPSMFVSIHDLTDEQIAQIKGLKGDKGDSLEFKWDGTRLGIKAEDDLVFQYTELKGEKGNDGIDGKDGYTPQKGIDYNDGIDGKDGYTPQKGIDYNDGIDGKDGKDGKDGTNGIWYGEEEPENKKLLWVTDVNEDDIMSEENRIPETLLVTGIQRIDVVSRLPEIEEKGVLYIVI